MRRLGAEEGAAGLDEVVRAYLGQPVGPHLEFYDRQRRVRRREGGDQAEVEERLALRALVRASVA